MRISLTMYMRLHFITLMSIIILCSLSAQIFVSRHREGFGFSHCMNNGFTKEFCVQTPVSYGGPGMCRTNDGQIGQVLGGWGGQCVVD
jgi:hypothetical protein